MRYKELRQQIEDNGIWYPAPQIENEPDDILILTAKENPAFYIMDIDQYRQIFLRDVEQIAEVRVGVGKFCFLPLLHQNSKTLNKICFAKV